MLKQAKQMANKYGADKQGLIQAINENGGMKKVDEAMGYLNNSKVKNALGYFGLSTQKIQNVYNEIKGTSTPQNNTSSNNLLDRFKNLK